MVVAISDRQRATQQSDHFVTKLWAMNTFNKGGGEKERKTQKEIKEQNNWSVNQATQSNDHCNANNDGLNRKKIKMIIKWHKWTEITLCTEHQLAKAIRIWEVVRHQVRNVWYVVK